MAITYVAATESKPQAPKKINGHTKPKPPITALDGPGRQMTGNMMAIYNVSHSTFCAGVKTGRYPPPDGYDGVRPFWLNETARKGVSATGQS